MIIKGIIRWLLLGGLVLLLPYFIPGIDVATNNTALIAAAVIGFINIFIKPILKLLTLPLRLMTLGIFGFILNVLLLWVASLLVPGFEITTLTAGVLGALVVTAVLWVLDRIF